MTAISDRVYLEISAVPPLADAPSGAELRSRLNQQCLTAVTAWLQAEFGLTARVDPGLPSIWAVVTGTAITVGSLRLVLLPTVAIGLDELRVPQEWVDMPAWAADYYLAIQVDPDQGGLEIVGYGSHHQLKTTGIYAAADRTYALDIDDLLQDIDSLLVAWSLSSAADRTEWVTRAAIAPLPPLPSAQAHSLLERLSNSALTFPRRAVPFPQWAALLNHGSWRQRLYERRQGRTASVPQWLRAGGASWWGWQPRECAGVGVRSLVSGLAKPLTIAGNAYELRVFPLGAAVDQTWRVELRRTDGLIPSGFKLRLLTEDLQMMEHNEHIATTAVEHLFIDVVMAPDEGVVWEIEPQPDDYDREILRF